MAFKVGAGTFALTASFLGFLQQTLELLMIAVSSGDSGKPRRKPNEFCDG
jgi:hypothetical protein